jgi:Tol biopolymer transport system component
MLSPGTQIGSYQVIALIGAGGMGEVYRARDTRLNRDVALKVLPGAFARDLQRMARFEREAKLLASLNHPNIAAIYGLEESGPIRALVMELVEGPTLAERIRGGAIPLDEALPIARQVADAVEYAHDKNVIHRDLKPANIKVTAEGMVKVLDFGLAKALSDDPTEGDMSNSPTLSMAATRQGVILGTAAYMSPEQAKGKQVDRRADVWAFGAVLYEMLTGKPAFPGDDITEVLAAVVKTEPAFDLLPAATPPAIRTLLRRCLEKNLRRRLGHMSEARILIEDVLSGAVPAEAAHAASPRKTRERLAWSAAAALLIAAVLAWGAFAFFRPVPAEPQAARFSIAPPERGRFNPNARFLTISPDGSKLAFIVADASGKEQLWIRPLDSEAAQPVPGTENAIQSFWSPDSQFLGFVADGKLRKIAVSGGPAQTLAETTAQTRGTWSQEGVVLFTPSALSTIHRVSAAGGTATPVTMLDASREETDHRWPYFLPDGNHFLYLAVSSNPENSAIFVASLDSNEKKLLLNANSNAAYVAPGYLLFSREQTLVAQPFDAERLELTGEAVPVAEDVQSNYAAVGGLTAFAASQNGVLAYRTGGAQNVQLTWTDRAGRKLGPVGEPGAYRQTALSPDGKRIAVETLSSQGRGRDLWLLDLSRGISSRLTSDPANEENPVWSPDGSQIAFYSNRKGVPDLYRITLSTGQEEVLLESGEAKYPEDWSKDGESLAYLSQQKFWLLPLLGDGKPKLILDTAFLKDEPQISPDGRWLAYNSDELGRWEVYVQPLQAPGEKLRLSTNGGAQPRWRKDGRELFYLALDGTMMAVPITAGATLVPGIPKSLFQTGITVNPTIDQFAVTGDGQRFLLVLPLESAPPISVVLNWSAALPK